MNLSRRQKKVASLIKEQLSPLLIELTQDAYSVLITITEVEMTSDLKTAYVYLSIFGHTPNRIILDLLNTRKGYLRKSIASRTKLKYNPQLFFSLDPSQEYERNIDDLLKNIKKDDKETD